MNQNEREIVERDRRRDNRRYRNQEQLNYKKIVTYAGTVIAGMLGNVWADYIHDNPGKYSETLGRVMHAISYAFNLLIIIGSLAVCVFLIMKLIDHIRRRDVMRIILFAIGILAVFAFIIGYFSWKDNRDNDRVATEDVSNSSEISDHTQEELAENIKSDGESDTEKSITQEAIKIEPGKQVTGSFDENTEEYKYCFTTDAVSSIELDYDSDIETGWARPDVSFSDAEDNLIVKYENASNAVLNMFTLDPGTYYLTITRRCDDERGMGAFSMKLNVSKSDSTNNVGGKKSLSNAVEIKPNEASICGIIHATSQENYYKFSIDDTSAVSIDYVCDIEGGWQRPNVIIYDTNKKMMVDYDDAPSEELKAFTLNSGIYYVLVKGVSNSNPTTFGNYSLGIRTERAEQGPNVGGTSSNMSDAEHIDVNGEELSGIIYSERKLNTYWFELEQPADISIGFRSDVEGGWHRPNVNIKDGKTKEVLYNIKEIPDGYSVGPALNPGKYYIEVIIDGDNRTRFGNFGISVKAQMNDEVVEKGSKDMIGANVQSLENGDIDINGVLQLDQKLSYFGFSLAESSNVNISAASEIKYKPSVTLLSENGDVIWDDEANELNRDTDLDAGKYYVCVKSKGDSNNSLGGYHLTIVKTESSATE